MNNNDTQYAEWWASLEELFLSPVRQTLKMVKDTNEAVEKLRQDQLENKRLHQEAKMAEYSFNELTKE
jgi:uncharacterized protein Yka (UPF0111/DUF47 family)